MGVRVHVATRKIASIDRRQRELVTRLLAAPERKKEIVGLISRLEEERDRCLRVTPTGGGCRGLGSRAR